MLILSNPPVAAKEGHDARGIANKFVQLARDHRERLTMMNLLKYVYFAHGWTLGHLDKPLFFQDVCAGTAGPVVMEVLHSYSGDGWLITGESLDKNGQPFQAHVSPEETEIINSVYADHYRLDSFALLRILQRHAAPWHKYRGQHLAVIPNQEIAAHYKGIIARTPSVAAKIATHSLEA